MTKRRLAALGTCGSLLAMAGVLRFAMRGYEVVACILVGVVALVLLGAFVGGGAFRLALAAAAVLAVAIAVTEGPIVGNARTDAGDDTAYIVVLGARVNEDGTPSMSLGWRLEAALDFLERHPSCKAVLSGARGDDEGATEAECMRVWLTQRGIEEGRLILEDESTNTQENIANSFELIAQREGGSREGVGIAVVSSSYHLYRAKLIAVGLGVRVTGIAAYPGNPVIALNYFIREAPAVWKQQLAG